MNEPDSESNGPPASRVPKRDTAAARKKSRDTGGSDVKKKAGEPKAMHFKDLLKLRLSASVRRVIEEGRTTAVNERFRGFFGTGLLLLSLETVGRNATQPEGHYAPRYFAEQIDRMAGAQFTAARKKFYDANRLPADSRPEKPEWFSLNLKGVFEAANRLPRHDRIIAARHVLVALLSFQPGGGGKTTNAWEILRDAGLDRRELLADFLESLANDGPIGERTEWKKIAERHPRPSPPPPVRGPYRARPGSRAPSRSPSGRGSCTGQYYQRSWEPSRVPAGRRATLSCRLSMWSP